MADVTEQKLQISVEASDKATNVLNKIADGIEDLSQTTDDAMEDVVRTFKHSEEVLKDFSETALKSAAFLSKAFGKDQVKQAENFAKVFRNFNKVEHDTKKGLDDIFSSDSAKSLGNAFSQLTSEQTSAITNFIKEPEKEFKNFADDALKVSEMLSTLFTKDEINRASSMAKAMRDFNEGWSSDTKAGMDKIGTAKNVEQLASAFSNLTSTQAAALTKLYEEPKESLTATQKAFNMFTKNAKKSIDRLKHGLEKIGNIITYRLIRQGMSLLVKQFQEGTKSVYLFARAFREMDQNHIAEKLDKYATLTARIQGNLGAVWATTMANLVNVLEPFLNKINEAISKVTAFTSALAGNSTYFKVAESYAKRYYETVTNGLQELNVIGSTTRYEETNIDFDTRENALSVKKNLEEIGNIVGGAMTGLGIILIASGHIVAGLGLAAAGLGITDLGNQLEGSDTDSKVKEIFQKIANIMPTIELGLGLVLLSTGNFAFGIPLVLAGGAGFLSQFATLDVQEEVKNAFLISAATLEAISLGLGIVLIACGDFAHGIPLVATGLVSGAYTIDGLEELGNKIKIWWWNLWEGNFEILGDEDAMWAAYYDAHPEKPEINTWEPNSSMKQLDNLDDYFPDKAADKALDELTRNNLFKSKLDFAVNGTKPNLEKVDLWTDFWTNFPLFLERFPGEYFADGGFPTAGSVFVAGEVPGQTELVGTINGRTGVAGGQEITGIRQAIYDVGAEVVQSIIENRSNVILEGDADKMFNVVRAKSADYTRRTGEFAF